MPALINYTVTATAEVQPLLYTLPSHRIDRWSTLHGRVRFSNARLFGSNADGFGSLFINGDDIVELRMGSDTVDVFGQYGVDGTGQCWISGRMGLPEQRRFANCFIRLQRMGFL